MTAIHQRGRTRCRVSSAIVAPASEDDCADRSAPVPGGDDGCRQPRPPRHGPPPPASRGCQRRWVRRWVRGPRTRNQRGYLPCNDYEYLDEPARPSGRGCSGRPAAGAGTVEYVAALAIAAIIIGAVVLGVNNAKVEVYSARVLCLIQSMVGAGQCDEAIGDGPGSGYGPGRRERALVLRDLRHRLLRPADDRPRRRGDPRRPGSQRPDRADDAQHGARQTGAAVAGRQQHPDRGRPRSATGAFWNGSEIVLGPGYDNAAVLVHEANHARYTVEGRHAEVSDPDRERVRAGSGRRGGRRHRAADPVGPGVPQQPVPSWAANPVNRNTMPRTNR